MARGKNWSAEEDMFLARAVVHVSHDARVGADQKSMDYWTKVFDQFMRFAPGSSKDDMRDPKPVERKTFKYATRSFVVISPQSPQLLSLDTRMMTIIKTLYKFIEKLKIRTFLSSCFGSIYERRST